MRWLKDLPNRVLARLTIASLRHLFGECETDVRDEYPGEDLICCACDTKRIIVHLNAIVKGDI